MPFHGVNETAHRLHHPSWAETAMEEFLAAVLTREGRVLVESLIMRLIRAFLATPSPPGQGGATAGAATLALGRSNVARTGRRLAAATHIDIP